MSHNLAVSPEAVARNLLKAVDEAYNIMINNYTTSTLKVWHEACQAVRDFRKVHPSAFEGLEDV